jgi:hypothetical protein
MQRLLMAGGWIAGCIGFGIAVFAFLRMGELDRELTAARNDVARLEGQLMTLAATPASPSAGGSAAQPAARNHQKAEPEAQAAAGKIRISPADVLKTIMANAEDPGGEDDTSNMAASMAQIFEGERGEQMAAFGAEMNVNMQYGDFLKSLQLDPETYAGVKDTLKRFQQAQMKAGIAMMNGGLDPEKMREDMEAAKAAMESDIADLLGPDDYTAFQAYQEELPRKMLEKNLDMQMSMMGVQLGAETKEMLRNVMTEEMLPLQQAAPGAMPPPDQAEAALTRQEQALDRILERMAPALGDAEYADVQAFIDQQRNMLQAASVMMRGMAEKTQEADSGAAAS